MATKTHEISAEQLIEALEKNYGIISSAIEYLRQHFGISIDRKTIADKIKFWDMDEFVLNCRKAGVEKALKKTFAKGIDEGDSNALGWILKVYGHHAEFLDMKEEGQFDKEKAKIDELIEELKK